MFGVLHTSKKKIYICIIYFYIAKSFPYNGCNFSTINHYVIIRTEFFCWILFQFFQKEKYHHMHHTLTNPFPTTSLQKVVKVVASV